MLNRSELRFGLTVANESSSGRAEGCEECYWDYTTVYAPEIDYLVINIGLVEVLLTS